ncbi:MAG: T9SS type A sorting domain-containing protein [Candidatus Aegiribacteria sp.]|nr:T9SS type A sorting domain-containing protein [Candidatus Aegiribacteria sp.]
MNRLIIALTITVVWTSIGLSVPEGIPIQYMDPRDRMPMSTSERMQLSTDSRPYSRTVIVEAGSDAEKVILLVEEDISTAISSALSTFQTDLESDGYDVEVWLISGGSAEDIRNDLKTEYSSGDLVGAICIGDIPTGWVDSGYGEYPVDVFLMDMNGTWNDPDSDGLYESYSSGGPEIWVGRLSPTYLTFGGAADLLNDYFARNHAYRTGALSLPDRALAYEEAFTGLTGYLHDLYSTVVTNSSPAGTNADDFKAELLNGYEWIHLISHSSPWGSSFHTGAPPAGAGTLNNFEVPPLDPHAFFYVLNCCSNGRWTEVDNLANIYIWNNSYGLVALAQTKVDYTNDFQEYYQSLAAGNCLGVAFRTWLASNMSMEDGAVLLGDPTLRPRMGTVCLTSFNGAVRGPTGSDSWLSYDITDGLHTQGRVDTYFDPSSGEIFAVCGSSDPVRANIIATHFDSDSWAQPIAVSNHEYWDWHPTVGGDGLGNVWAAWQSMQNNHEGYDIYISQWNGTSWVNETILTDGDPFEVEPAMDGGNGHTWLVWQKWQNSSTDIEGVFWTGSTWSDINTVSVEDGEERHPDVAYSGNGFGLVYHARRDGNWVICFRDAPDSGPFGAETVISSSTENSRYASITSDGSDYWVAWQDDNGAILCSHGSGSGWTTPETVSSSGGCVRSSIISSSAGDITAMWTFGTSELHYNTYAGGEWQGYYAAVSEDAVDDASLAWSGSKLWAVYGRRDTDLQWDLWACTPDPVGIAGPSSASVSDLSVYLVGRNPFRGSVVLSITSLSPAKLRIFDLSGRSVLDREVESGLFTWNGTTDYGDPIPSGVYFVIVSNSFSTESCRLIKI